MQIIRLLRRLDAIDLENMNRCIRNGMIRLDWTDVEPGIPLLCLKRLLAGLSLEDIDARTASPTVLQEIHAAFASLQAQEQQETPSEDELIAIQSDQIAPTLALPEDEQAAVSDTCPPVARESWTQSISSTNSSTSHRDKPRVGNVPATPLGTPLMLQHTGKRRHFQQFPWAPSTLTIHCSPDRDPIYPLPHHIAVTHQQFIARGIETRPMLFKKVFHSCPSIYGATNRGQIHCARCSPNRTRRLPPRASPALTPTIGTPSHHPAHLPIPGIISENASSRPLSPPSRPPRFIACSSLWHAPRTSSRYPPYFLKLRDKTRKDAFLFHVTKFHYPTALPMFKRRFWKGSRPPSKTPERGKRAPYAWLHSALLRSNEDWQSTTIGTTSRRFATSPNYAIISESHLRPIDKENASWDRENRNVSTSTATRHNRTHDIDYARQLNTRAKKCSCLLSRSSLAALVPL